MDGAKLELKNEIITELLQAMDEHIKLAYYLESVYKVSATNKLAAITLRLYPITLQNIFCP
jgi:hypothetical protein